ncbi:MAG: transcription elongation factor GreA [Paludibacteraceae bacterium]|nr:transcription elongation factor GreA [Paludibacteraceae bacterium]MBO7337278.1 transcription elongation factor GreA [Paludibacteraceae bacterium]MBP5136971.1 transcription elongation factor GreA [Paludibacteraceae bacterium]MBP5741942.1 transcription elongation factor GreA [Paludibacteraceae bacterium]
MAAVYMTKEGQQKKLDELNHLENVERPRIIQQIADARDKGDLSENAEYDAAKEEQGMIESKISELKTLLANVRIIDESKVDTSSVQLLTTVTIKNVKNGATMKYTIVTENEANLKEHKISAATPIAKGLIGKKKGEIAEISAPNGKMEFEIIDITME